MGVDTVTRGAPPATMPGTEGIVLDATNNVFYSFGASGAPVALLSAGRPLPLTSQTTANAATAGAANALPATPAGYLTLTINGTAAKIPYYAT